MLLQQCEMVLRQTGLPHGLFAASQNEINNIKLEEDSLEDVDFLSDPMLCDDNLDLNLENNFDIAIEDLLDMC